MTNQTKKSQKPEPWSEQRRHQRIDARIELPYWKYVKFKRDNQVHIGFVKNISKGGVFLETEVIFPPQTEIGFEFYVSTSTQPIIGTATVVWARKKPEVVDGITLVPGMGLQFKSFEGEGAATLGTFFDQEAKRKS